MVTMIGRNTRWLVLAFLAAVLSNGNVSAQGITATSCEQSDVQAAVTKAPVGATVNIPAGTCTWTSGVTVSDVGINIIGAGTAKTTVIDNVANGPLFNVTIPAGQTFRLSSMTLTPQRGATSLYSPIQVIGTCSTSGCPNLRVDNVAFVGWSTSNSTYNGWLILTDNMFGVIDHNVVTQATGGSGGSLANVNHSGYLGVGQYGDNSWSQPTSFGTGNALYLEDNTLEGGPNLMAITDCDHADAVEHVGGCRMVVRFNKLTNTTVQTHGTETTGRPRGARQVEVYGNAFMCTNTTQGCATGTNMRSGVALNYSNTYSTGAGSWFVTLLQLDAYRVNASLGGWGSCTGEGPWDTNDGVIYASGSITGVGVSNGVLTVTDSTKNWSTGQWVSTGNPYSVVNTTLKGHPGYEITSNSAASVVAGGYGQDYWNGPPTFRVGDQYQILRASLCIDQPSRSGGRLLSGGTPTAGPMNQTLDPSYEWNDTISAGSTMYGKRVGSSTAKIIANRDYHSEATPFTGASGTGTGLLSERPAACVPSVAFWATDANTLYRCSAENTWSKYYRPYGYPHPLVAGLLPPANLRIVR